jgi:heme A synthase
VLLRRGENSKTLRRLANGWLTLILFQAFLGAFTVWSNKAADVATAHVAFGALSLVCGGLIYIGTAPLAAKAPRTEEVPVPHAQPVLS